MGKSRLEAEKKRGDELRKNEHELVRRTGANMHSLLNGREDSFYEAVKTALHGERDVQHLRDRIKRIGEDAKVLAGQADRIMGEHFPNGSE